MGESLTQLIAVLTRGPPSGAGLVHASKFFWAYWVVLRFSEEKFNTTLLEY